MAYQSNIPQATNLISASQSDILGNFQFLGDTTGNLATGYYYLPNGLIVQWGEATGLATGLSANINFPVTFPNNVFSILVTEVQNSTSKAQSIKVNTEPVGPNITSFNLIVVSVAGTFTNTKAYWFAIGN